MSKENNLYKDKDYLFYNYITLEKPTTQIAKECNVVFSTINVWLKKFDIKMRTKSDVKKGKNHPLYGKHLSEEHKKKIRNSMQGKNTYKKTEATKRKMSESKKGNQNARKKELKMHQNSWCVN